MRLMPVISAALVLSTSHLSFAQEWIEFASRDDRFTCLFPSQPKITETTYLSPHEADLPARVYAATQGHMDDVPINRIQEFHIVKVCAHIRLLLVPSAPAVVSDEDAPRRADCPAMPLIGERGGSETHRLILRRAR